MQGHDIEIEAQFKEYADQEEEYVKKAQKAKLSKSAALSLSIDKDPSPASATSAGPTSGPMTQTRNSESRFLITHLKPDSPHYENSVYVGFFSKLLSKLY